MFQLAHGPLQSPWGSVLVAFLASIESLLPTALAEPLGDVPTVSNGPTRTVAKTAFSVGWEPCRRKSFYWLGCLTCPSFFQCLPRPLVCKGSTKARKRSKRRNDQRRGLAKTLSRNSQGGRPGRVAPPQLPQLPKPRTGCVRPTACQKRDGLPAPMFK